MELRKVTFRKKGRIQGLGSLADEFVQKDKKHRQVFNDAEHRHAIRPHHACQHMDGYQGKDRVKNIFRRRGKAQAQGFDSLLKRRCLPLQPQIPPGMQQHVPDTGQRRRKIRYKKAKTAAGDAPVKDQQQQCADDQVYHPAGGQNRG